VFAIALAHPVQTGFPNRSLASVPAFAGMTLRVT